jgi:uncharacterized membrane protein YdjX (TVP38/TMEM64 family)
VLATPCIRFTTAMQPLLDWLAASEQFFQNLGWLGLLAFGLLMTAAGIASLPLSPLAIAAGVMFGLGKGLLAVQLGTTLSAAVNFLISRHIARDLVARKISTHPKFRAVDAAVGREGWKIVAMLRLVPTPFGLLNYAFGLTAVRFVPYLLATAVTIIIPNTFFTWLGATAQAGLQAALGAGRPRHPMETVFMLIGLGAAFAVMFYTTKLARAAIARRDESLASDTSTAG